MNKIGVFTSGGDSPGMNACIRAVVRTGIYHGVEVAGIEEGFSGMIAGDIIPLSSSDVSNIISRGGTILRSARCEAFRTAAGRKQAFDQLSKNKIDALVAIGGDGTFTGAKIFSEEFGIPIVGVPGTIDNDLFGTDNTLGYDTALNTVVEAIDKLKDTANSHNRLFVVEVMGRDAGFIALRSGIAAGAEAILVPEIVSYKEDLLKKLNNDWNKNKHSAILVVAEGDDLGGGQEVAEFIKQHDHNYEVRLSILGHIQRGGKPSAYDRVLGSQLGNAAVESLLNGRNNCMVGVAGKNITHTPFDKAIKHHKQLHPSLVKLAEVLAI